MTTRQLSSLTATPGMGGGGAAGGGGRDFSGTGSHVTPGGGSNVGGGGGGANVQKLEEKILKLQEDLTSAYRLQSENSNTFLRLKEQAEKDEKALLRKEEELDKASRSVISLTNELSAEKQRSIERNRHLEQTCELLRGEVQGTRAKVAAMEAKLKQLTVDNDTLLTTILKLKEEQSNEQNELNTVKQELVRATAEAKHAAEVKKSQEEKGHIQPQEIDVTDMNALIDHVAWTSNFNVVIPTERKRTIRGHRGPVTCIRYNTAGTLFASAGVDGLVKIYDARTGGNRASLRGTKDCVMNVAFSQDDALMLASGNDSISRIWSLKTSRVMHTLVGHTAKIWAGTFTAQGNQVVTGSHDRTLKIWSV
jgi:hypothetical protein